MQERLVVRDRLDVIVRLELARVRSIDAERVKTDGVEGRVREPKRAQKNGRSWIVRT
jgi:hypothetical protein